MAWLVISKVVAGDGRAVVAIVNVVGNSDVAVLVVLLNMEQGVI